MNPANRVGANLRGQAVQTRWKPPGFEGFATNWIAQARPIPWTFIMVIFMGPDPGVSERSEWTQADICSDCDLNSEFFKKGPHPTEAFSLLEIIRFGQESAWWVL